MKSEIELKKKNFERFVKDNPLELHWLKKDFIRPCEAVLIYYGINPSHDSMVARDEQIIRMVDWCGVYDVLLSSKFLLYSQGSFELPKFVEWLGEKDFPIATHLQIIVNVEDVPSSSSMSKKEKTKLSSIKLSALIEELSARLMIKLMEDPKYNGKASTDITRSAVGFKALRATVPHLRDVNDDYSDGQYQRWTSPFGSRAHK